LTRVVLPEPRHPPTIVTGMGASGVRALYMGRF
jgi:hypothetical protein